MYLFLTYFAQPNKLLIDEESIKGNTPEKLIKKQKLK